MFGRYRTVKVKVPRQCCPWCQVQTEMLDGRVQVLEAKVDGLQRRLEAPLTVILNLLLFNYWNEG
jgi:hypothetical protein